MGDDSRAFVPIRDEAVRLRGIMDQTTAACLSSEGPDPSQQSLDALLNRVTRIRVVPLDDLGRNSRERRLLLDTSNPESIASFRACIAIVENPESFFHCMCPGDPHIELYAGTKVIGTIGYHHGVAIRWSGWRHDALLREPARLLEWMSGHGVNGPRVEVEAARRAAEESLRDEASWLAAMPECLRPFWERMGESRDPELQRVLLEALEGAIPARERQALVLFGWFGAGKGPWSGVPSYEYVPEELLLQFSTALLVGALTAETPSEAQWRGAARYFGGWEFGHRKKCDKALLAADLKRRLLDAALGSGIADNIARAERAFEP